MTAVPIPPFEAEGVHAVPLPADVAPRRIALVRLHAFGDAAIALPLLAGLARRFPDCRLEVVTGPAAADLFHAREEVGAVHVLDARAPRPARWGALLRVARALRARPLDALLDLQRSRLSRALRLAVRPRAWCLFDRFAPFPALERYRAAVETVLGPVPPLCVPRVRPEAAARAERLLADAGRDPERPLVALNPAGGWETKRWPLERWAALGRALTAERGAQLLLQCEGAPAARVKELARSLGPGALDLTGRTGPAEAMAAVASCALMVSEDSGLMHLAWTQGVPTLALFGASRATWSRPLGERTHVFGSEDLPCGACLSPACARGDIHCLARVSAEEVAASAADLLRRAAAPGRPR